MVSSLHSHSRTLNLNGPVKMHASPAISSTVYCNQSPMRGWNTGWLAAVFPKSGTGAAINSQVPAFENKKPIGLSTTLPGPSIIAWHPNTAGGYLSPVKNHTVNSQLPLYWMVKPATWCWIVHLLKTAYAGSSTTKRPAIAVVI